VVVVEVVGRLGQQGAVLGACLLVRLLLTQRFHTQSRLVLEVLEVEILLLVLRVLILFLTQLHQ
jgi:hypothetical protein